MSGHLGRSVSIIGVGYTHTGDVLSTPQILNFSERELMAAASMEAMEDGNIEAKDIEAYYLGWVGMNYYGNTQCGGPHFAEWMGLKNKPVVCHDEGCASFIVSLQQAILAVASGMYDTVLAGGVNCSMSMPERHMPPHFRKPMDQEHFWDCIATANDPAYDHVGIGALTPSCEGYTIDYCRKYGVTLDQIAQACNRYVTIERDNALKNPKYTFSKETYEEEAARMGFNSVDEYLMSDVFNPKMGVFLRPKWSGLMLDGASAIIVCATDVAEKYTKKAVEVGGIAANTFLAKEYSTVPIAADVKMWKELYSMAGVVDPHKEIDYLSVHDCPCLSLMQYGEGGGYFEEGTAWRYMLEGRTAIDGDRPVNTSGGRTQLGHPVAAATGIEIAEAVYQMRGEAGARQIKNAPKTSVIHGGGAGISSSLILLRML